jgi:hypothetical protein
LPFLRLKHLTEKGVETVPSKRVTDTTDLPATVVGLAECSARHSEEIKNIREKLDVIREWENDHINRMHSVVDIRLSNHSARMNWIMGVGSAVSAVIGWLGFSK